jgi:hypothetical protein
MSYKGVFKPKNPGKYKGDYNNIIYRSSWELKLMIYLDSHPDILQWSSEEFYIPYRSPIDGKLHKYFPDFYVKKNNSNGITESLVIEVKPKKQVTPPKVKKEVDRKYLKEVKTYGINSAKWKAAREYCELRKWKFIIMTEKELGLNG